MVNIENRHLSEGHRSIAECNCSIIVAVVVSHSNTGPSHNDITMNQQLGPWVTSAPQPHPPPSSPLPV